MRVNINGNSLKNAMGTVFLLAAAFFVCSTFISMRSVFADPVVPANNNVQRSGRVSPRSSATTSRANTSRSTVSRATSARTPGAVVQSRAKTDTSRGVGTRTVSTRTVTPTRTTNTATRNLSTRAKAQNRTISTRATRARTATTPSRVSVSGTPMSGSRASTSTTYSYLSSKLYTGSYANIIDSSTGLISAEAYANCMDSYYTCMDEICTARSDTKGRCSCAGRATNFLEAETQLEAANEELIKLSGQLSLLIATKGKGDDLAAAFSLTDAEKVMNCVSYKEAEDKNTWCDEHPSYNSDGTPASCAMPSYCTKSGNSFGFDIKNIDGSSSDILAQLKAWADAKDLAKQYSKDNTDVLATRYDYISNVVNDLSYSTSTKDSKTIDTLANKWGYKLFEYAHNNVCGRVLDSCFNGIYEACGAPVSVQDSDGKTHNKCANGATSNCPFNYNSYISVATSGNNAGDIKLNERTAGTTTAVATASCFGYTTTTTSTGTRAVSTSSSDPYYSLRGPVADARRSIMQKYLLDANAACDVYGANLKQTAQNINYQKIAAEQALQAKRLEFKQDAENQALADSTNAATNFDECLSELLDCYETQSDNTTSNGAKWTLSRVKTYCAQISQVPHCYETMVCNPSTAQFHAVIDLPDSNSCFNSQEYDKNTCRNVVSISEILYRPSVTATYIDPDKYGSSLAMREKCLLDAGVEQIRTWTPETVSQTACTVTEVKSKDVNARTGYSSANYTGTDCEFITSCESEYILYNNECHKSTQDCTSSIANAESAVRTYSNGVYGDCVLYTCKTNYVKTGNTCVANTINCPAGDLNSLNATSGNQTWDGSDWGACQITACATGYTLTNNTCVED